jgi:hypothetical protein
MSPQKSDKKSQKESGKKQGAINLSQNKSESKKNDKELNENQTGKILGAFFVIAGLLLIGVLLIFYILSKLPYRTDPNIPIPTLEEADEYTNEDTIDISGEVVPGETVVLYKDDDMTNKKVKADDDGDFTFEDIELEEEDEYKFQAASTRGWILKKRSEKSNAVYVTYDATDPSAKVNLEYPKETDSDSVTIKGEAEKDSLVILKKDGEEYETETDEEGNFELKNVQLDEGENEFEVIVEDKAGNRTTSSTDVNIARIARKDSGDLNGPGASDERDERDERTANGENEDLPESAGELEAALEIISQNNLMFALGLMAVLVFAASSAGVYFFNKRTN